MTMLDYVMPLLGACFSWELLEFLIVYAMFGISELHAIPHSVWTLYSSIFSRQMCSV